LAASAVVEKPNSRTAQQQNRLRACTRLGCLPQAHTSYFPNIHGQKIGHDLRQSIQIDPLPQKEAFGFKPLFCFP